MLSSRALLMLTGLGALLVIGVLFAGLATRPANDGAILVVEAQRMPPLAPETTSSTSTTSSAPTTTAASSTPTAATSSTTASESGVSGTDARGFVDSDARCDTDQTAVAVGRTQRSLVVICAEAAGGYEYRGVRISDGVSLITSAEATGDGTFVARNDDAAYTVSPKDLVVTSGGKVIYRDTWVAYEAPSFAAEHGAATSTAAPATPATTTAQKPR